MKPEDLKAYQEKKQVLYSRVFTTGPGTEVLEDLVKRFDGDCYNDDLAKMAALNGQRQVILYIKRMIKLGENNAG